MAAPRSVEKGGGGCPLAAHEVYGGCRDPLAASGRSSLTLEHMDARKSCYLVGDPNGKERTPASRDRKKALAFQLQQSILRELHSTNKWPTSQQFWEDCLPVGGTLVAAVLARLLLMRLDTLEKFTENWIPWDGSHSIVQGITPLPEWTDDLKWGTDQNSHTLSPCTVSGKKGGARGKKGVLKGLFYFSLSFSQLIINLLYTSKFELVLPLTAFFQSSSQLHSPSLIFSPRLCPAESKRGWVMGFHGCLAFGRHQTMTYSLLGE